MKINIYVEKYDLNYLDLLFKKAHLDTRRFVNIYDNINEVNDSFSNKDIRFNVNQISITYDELKLIKYNNINAEWELKKYLRDKNHKEFYSANRNNKPIIIGLWKDTSDGVSSFSAALSFNDKFKTDPYLIKDEIENVNNNKNLLSFNEFCLPCFFNLKNKFPELSGMEDSEIFYISGECFDEDGSKIEGKYKMVSVKEIKENFNYDNFKL